MTEPRHRLTAGHYEAVISEVGGALHTLRHGQQGRRRDLVRSTDDAPALPNYRGAVLAPWPNRIADGRYDFGGQRHQLAINEVERGCALHGLVARQGWQPQAVSAAAVTLGCVLWPQPGYPYALELAVTYALDERTGLSVRVTAHNIGKREAPYGVALHPYLVAGPGHVDDWWLRLPAGTVLRVDSERLLPIGSKAVDATTYDFRASRQVRGTELDHCYTDVDFDGDGRATVELTAPDGTGTQMSWDSRSPYVQVHTADSATGSLFRTGLAVEPMTCAPDAFNSGDGLLRLAPEEQHAVGWTIRAITH